MTPEEKAAADKAAAEKKAAEDEAAADKKAAAEDEAARSRQSSKRSELEKKQVTAFRLIREIEQETGKPLELTRDEDDDKPVTRGELRRIEIEKSQKTALELANEIQDENERAVVIDELTNTIIPSGNPQKDLEKAQSYAQAEKNRQIAAEAARKRNAPNRASGSGAPPRQEDHFEANADEMRAARMVGKRTEADIKAFILKARARRKS